MKIYNLYFSYVSKQIFIKYIYILRILKNSYTIYLKYTLYYS